MEHRVLLAGLEADLRGNQLAHRDAVERPAVRGCHSLDLLARLRERHVQHRLAALHACQEELECERGLARARHAFDQVKAIWREPAAKDVVEAGDAGGSARRRSRHEEQASLPTRKLALCRVNEIMPCKYCKARYYHSRISP